MRKRLEEEYRHVKAAQDRMEEEAAQDAAIRRYEEYKRRTRRGRHPQ